MTRRRQKTRVTVTRNRRVYRVVKITRDVLQCERPYVLFGEAVKNVRIDLGFTQQELADKLKVSRGSIANIETGRQRILLSDVFDFAKVLKVKPIALFVAASA
jgi:DNA-binding XRE family transcriptional regulator